MVRAECDVAPVQNSVRRTEKQQTQSRIRKVATLARAEVKKVELWLRLEMLLQFQSLNKLFKKLKASILLILSHQHQYQIQFQLCSCLKLLKQVPSTLRKMPRLSEPGPLGMRAEHWYDFGSLWLENSDLFVQGSCSHCCG